MRKNGLEIALCFLFVVACTKDARIVDTDDNVMRADGRATDMDGGCVADAEPAWCLDASVMTADANRDARSPILDADEKEEGKKFNGWSGDRDSIKYTLYDDTTVLCDIRYSLREVRAVDDCNTCIMAMEATLRDVTIESNDGDCDGPAELDGHTLYVGHGTDELSQGIHTLWIKTRSGWSIAENSYSVSTVEGWTYYLSSLGDSAGSTENEQGMMCPNGFDPTAPCAPDEKCLLAGTWYYCEDGVWMRF